MLTRYRTFFDLAGSVVAILPSFRKSASHFLVAESASPISLPMSALERSPRLRRMANISSLLSRLRSMPATALAAIESLKRVNLKEDIRLSNSGLRSPALLNAASIAPTPEPRFSQTARRSPIGVISSSKRRSVLLRVDDIPSRPSKSTVTGPKRPPGFNTAKRFWNICTCTGVPPGTIAQITMR